MRLQTFAGPLLVLLWMSIAWPTTASTADTRKPQPQSAQQERWDGMYRDGRKAPWDIGRPSSDLKRAVENGTLRPCRVVDCTCPPSPKVLTPPEKQTARLAVEKRKKGKVVTVVRGLPADENDLPALLSQLKAACGAGGTVKDDVLEIQGDHLERVRGLLAEIGYRVCG